jgi:hypothetical protein
MNTVIYAIAGGIKNELAKVSSTAVIKVDSIDLDIERELVNIEVSTSLETTIFSIDEDSVSVWDSGFDINIAVMPLKAGLQYVHTYAWFIAAICNTRDADNKINNQYS